jgi:predicted Zn-dependent peptidase
MNRLSHPGVRAVCLAIVICTRLGVLAAERRAEVPVQQFTLDNGMKFLLVTKPELSTVSAGWVARVGSANERPGITGISHFFEHMMFKGSPTVGTRDSARDAAIMDEMEQIQDRLRALYRVQRERWRAGEIEGPYLAAARSPEIIELEAKFDALAAEQKQLTIPNDFDQIYTVAGASGMNAFTNADNTVYFITVPANKLELWMWMESERLLRPVFREFYAERSVVHEERRLRTESTPTGIFNEQLDSMFWQSHPYNWPVVGWPDDLRSYTMQQAKDYFATFYAPHNITAALVGNLDVAAAKALATKYFGRIPKSDRTVPDVVTTEMPQLAEKRMTAECDCQPQIEVRYHTVPFMHKDTYALEVLAALLSGQTGRLNKQLVLDTQIAASAAAAQGSQKWAGSFSFYGTTKGDATPQQLEAAWYAELKKIQDEGVPPRELEKVKNNVAADAYRRLENPFFLMVQLLYYEGVKTWEYLNRYAELSAAVTSDDVKRVANTYFEPENRLVGIYLRKAGTTAEVVPAEFQALPAQVQQGLMAQVKQIKASTDIASLEAALQGLGQQKGAVPPQFKAALDYIEQVLIQRIAELKNGGAQ